MVEALLDWPQIWQNFVTSAIFLEVFGHFKYFEPALTFFYPIWQIIMQLGKFDVIGQIHMLFGQNYILLGIFLFYLGKFLYSLGKFLFYLGKFLFYLGKILFYLGNFFSCCSKLYPIGHMS